MITKEKIAEIIHEETWIEVDSAHVYGIEEAAEKVFRAIGIAQQNAQADEAYCEANHVDDPNKIGWLFCPYCGKQLHR